ncbi:MAG: H-NS histone family protein [Myxococcota bacterium]
MELTPSTLDLSAYGIEQLEALVADAEKRLAELRQEKRRQAFQELDAVAKSLGFSRDDLAQRYGKPIRSRRNGPEAGYRNPANPDQIWNGRGRKPAWVRAWLEAGKSLADLES